MPTMQRPSDLRISDEVAEAFATLSPHLTAKGQQQFTREIVAALRDASKQNNLAPVQDVIEAWYRTLVVMSAPGHEEEMARGEGDPDPANAESLDDLRKRLLEV